MATGTVLHFLSYSEESSLINSPELYQDYINQVKATFKDQLLVHSKEDPVFFPVIFKMETDDGTELMIFNERPGTEIPTSRFLYIAQDYSTDFNSCHMVLADFWDLDQYSPNRSQHVITDSEIAQLIPVCDYVTSDLIHHKDASRFENIMLSENCFLKTFLDNLPSRQYPKEFSSDNGELHEDEDCLMYFCRQFATFMKFYLAMNKDFDLDHRKYSLVYTKW